jgi:hypothetical protein
VPALPDGHQAVGVALAPVDHEAAAGPARQELARGEVLVAAAGHQQDAERLAGRL